MKSLIVFYSHSGNNEKLAYELGRRINCDIHKIMEEKKRNTLSILLDYCFKRKAKLSIYNINMEEYNNIIFVSPIWGGKIASPMRTFIEEEKDNLKRYFFITICNGEKGQKEKIVTELDSVVHHNPTEVTELCINTILPDNKKNKIRHTFNFRISKQEINHFRHEIDSFVSRMNE